MVKIATWQYVAHLIPQLIIIFSASIAAILLVISTIVVTTDAMNNADKNAMSSLYQKSFISYSFVSG
jgi:hypothetical protein